MTAPSEQTSESASATQSPASRRMFGDCWGCRILSGGGLLAAAGYVFQAARGTMRLGGPTSMGTVAQIAFAASLAAWGVVVIADPVATVAQTFTSSFGCWCSLQLGKMRHVEVHSHS
ncbi:hypothetical protein GJAV_G00130110 [Gymnothorax javanicus]|nr:hypothetical protein GJAV_G00130110 [Gymnothorax javanicus]